MAALVAAGVMAIGVFAAPSDARQSALLHATCSASYVDGIIGGAHKCLRDGEFCSPSHAAEYVQYGFSCVDGHLKRGGGTSGGSGGSTASSGSTYPDLPVLLHARTRLAGCKLAALPDRRCSPGAYSRSLTMAVLCSPTFRTGSVRDVSEATRHEIEQEYGLVPKSYGRSLEIDHIVSLELGGSNDPANLYPEEAVLPNHQPGYHVKDKLENAAHRAVCSGQITLAYAQHQIAANWELLYKRLFGASPAAN